MEIDPRHRTQTVIKQEYLVSLNLTKILIRETQRDWFSDLETSALPTSELKLYIGYKHCWDNSEWG